MYFRLLQSFLHIFFSEIAWYQNWPAITSFYFKDMNCLLHLSHVHLSVYPYAFNFVLISFGFTDFLPTHCICFYVFQVWLLWLEILLLGVMRMWLLLSLITWVPSLGLCGEKRALTPQKCALTQVPGYMYSYTHAHAQVHACTQRKK